MKNLWLTWLNALGVLALSVLSVIQWKHDRAEHAQYVEEHTRRESIAGQLAKSQERVTSLEGDTERLKKGLLDTQKVADEASGVRVQLEGQVKTTSTERDELKKQLIMWDAAVKERDARITELTTKLREARERLEEAIKRIEGKKEK